MAIATERSLIEEEVHHLAERAARRPALERQSVAAAMWARVWSDSS